MTLLEEEVEVAVEEEVVEDVGIGIGIVVVGNIDDDVGNIVFSFS